MIRRVQVRYLKVWDVLGEPARYGSILWFVIERKFFSSYIAVKNQWEAYGYDTQAPRNQFNLAKDHASFLHSHNCSVSLKHPLIHVFLGVKASL